MPITPRIILSFLLCLGYLTNVWASTPTLRFERQWPLLDSAWALNQPAAVATDTDNNLYVVDTYNHRVQQFTASGNFIRTFGSEGSGNGQVLFPADVAIGADGTVFVLDNGNNRVQIFDTNGVWLKSVGHGGSGAAEFSLPQPTFTAEGVANKQGALALDIIHGLLYVADAGNQRIQVLTTQGDFLYTLVDGQLNQPGGLAVDPYTSNLYVVDRGNQRVLLITPERNIYPLNWHFDHPTALAVNEATGWFYVVNETLTGNSEIVVFDVDGFYQTTFDTTGQLIGATGLAINQSGDLYAADTGHLIVQWLDAATGGFNWYFGNSAPFSWLFDGLAATGASDYANLFNGYFYLPASVAVSKSGTVYVVDTGNSRIQWFDKDGQFLGKFGLLGTANGALNFPTSIAISAEDNLYVADTNNNRLQVFSANGTWLGVFGSAGSGPGQFNAPTDVAFSPSGQVVVADSGNHRIQLFTPTGEFVTAWGSFGTGNGQFDTPSGVALAADGTVYVSDTGNHRVQHFTATGAFIGSIGHKGTGQGEFDSPARLTVAADQSIFVVDADNNRIQQFSAQGAFLQTLGAGGVTEGQFRSPSALAIAADQSLYVADTLNSRIQKFKPTDFVPVQKSITHPFKAIILAGGGSSNNPLWDSTQILANRAFTTLRAQGFQKDEIRYLTSGNPQMDLDSNGNNTDDLIPASLQALETALTSWASDANDVVVYLIDHGGPGTFKVNSQDILTREQLGQWLQSLEAKLPAQGKVTVIIEACKSAGFFAGLPAIPPEKRRTLIASANPDQPALIGNQGLVSFSYYFWSEVRSGATLQDAFKTARQGMSAQEVVVAEKLQRQEAQLDANNDGTFNQADYSLVGNDCLGNCIATAADEPDLQEKTQETTLNGETTLALSIQVKSLEPLVRAWVSISRPDSQHADTNQPISELPAVDLACKAQANGLYSCQGSYAQFDTQGRYTLAFYAQDKNTRTSMPGITVITQTVGNAAPAISRPETRYLPAKGEAILEDVLVNGQHYWATLRDQGGFRFTLTDYHLTTSSENPASQFDLASQRLLIPKIAADGVYYRVLMHATPDGVFTVDEVTGL